MLGDMEMAAALAAALLLLPAEKLPELPGQWGKVLDDLRSRLGGDEKAG